MKRGLMGMVGDIEHLLFHLLRQILMPGAVDRMADIQPSGLYRLFYFQAVKFQPYIFPGQFIVRNIGADLVGKNHEALSAPDLVGNGIAAGVLGGVGARR